ncbi:MAG TPA: glycosyltransferase family 39 protein [Steroidobacteraceae bacterium]|nr:glycosyltransferase family 39 protein [Steroidobacteraceae bacterium]
MPENSRSLLAWLGLAVLAAWFVGMFGRAYWTPDEPREADLSWRMSWQAEKSVPLLAGEAFCEKPPLAYWAAGAAMHAFGKSAWAARLPNLLYALITAWAVLLLARRSAGPVAALAAAAAIATFLLAYQVAIWLATDAPLLAAGSVALLGEYQGFYAERRQERWRGYTLMHAALAAGFLAKSGAAWMVPALVLATLVVWERRWRELLRWELYAGLLLQALVISIWVWSVYSGSDGAAHLKVFFWDNLVGRFTRVAAPAGLQYTSGHQNSPGKYLLELPLYLWPWTLLGAAAVRRAWTQRRAAAADRRAVRFAAACMLPTLALLSIAATARDIYLAPALPGAALLIGWWAANAAAAPDPWDLRAVRATAAMLLLACVAAGAAAALIGYDAWQTLPSRALYVTICAGGIAAAAGLALGGWRLAGRANLAGALAALLAAYCALSVFPASQIYRQVDRWHDLASIGRTLRADLGGAPLVLIGADETTRAWVDMYTTVTATRIPAPVGARGVQRLRASIGADSQRRFLVELGGRDWSPRILALARALGVHLPVGHGAPPAWVAAARLGVERIYALPFGRRYALLEAERAATPRNKASY